MSKNCREYYPIWKKLRDSVEHTCSIEANVLLHRRIIKAVIKEKYMDTVYKTALEKIGMAARIDYERHGLQVVFRLVVKKVVFSLDDF